MEKDRKFELSSVLLLASSHFIHDVYTAFLAPLLPALIEKLGMDYLEASILIAALRVPSIFSPYAGAIADKFAPRYFAIFAPAITAIAMSFIGVASDYFWALFALLIAGVSSAFYHAPTPVLMKKASGDRVGTGMSFFMFGGELARTIGPIFILSAVALLGLERTYLLSVLGILFSLILYLRFKDVSVKEDVKKTKPVKALEIFKKHKKLFVPIIALVFTKSFLIISMTSFLPTYMTAKGAALWLAGGALSILELAGAGGALLSGTISDKIGARKTLLAATIAAPIFITLFVFSNGWLEFPLLVVIGILSFSYSPILMAVVQKSEDENPSAANGIFMSINFGISALVVLAFGQIGDMVNLDYAYLASAALSLTGIPFIFKLPREAEKTA